MTRWGWGGVDEGLGNFREYGCNTIVFFQSLNYS